MTGSKHPRVFHLITRLLKGGAEAKTIATVRGLDGYKFTVGYGAEYDPEQVDLLSFRNIRVRVTYLSGSWRPESWFDIDSD